jgi:hypothetical protein
MDGQAESLLGLTMLATFLNEARRRRDRLRTSSSRTFKLLNARVQVAVKDSSKSHPASFER